MQRKILFLALVFSLTISQNIFSQNASLDENFLNGDPTEELKEISGNAWSVYSDDESQLYYVDFENLTVNLNDIVVKDENAKVVFTESVFELPVDTIYELDMKGYPKGNYQLELRSFTAVIRKTISVK